MFLAIGYPYQMLIHSECAPYYSYNGFWPHPHPAIFYLTSNNNIIAQNDATPSSSIQQQQSVQPSPSPIHSDRSEQHCSRCRAQWN